MLNCDEHYHSFLESKSDFCFIATWLYKKGTSLEIPFGFHTATDIIALSMLQLFPTCVVHRHSPMQETVLLYQDNYS
jgi:hypothetical protein